MTDQAAPALAGGEAQPIADAMTVESILKQGNRPIEETESTPEKSESESTDQEVTETADNKPDEMFPKKAINALSRRDKQIGKLKAELAAERVKSQQFEQQIRPQQPSPKTGDMSVSKTGIPTKLDENSFKSWAEFSEARAEEIADYKIDQKLNERDGKQKETIQNQQQQAWISEREQNVAKKAQEFAKAYPEAAAVIDENADLADEFSPEIQKLFLEADNAPLAFYNLAKEGKLEALMGMSPARAAMEIGRAQAQAIAKPKTKAPTPLPASRGSVPAGKSLENLTAREAHKLLSQKD